MAELNIHVDVRITPRLFRWGLAGLLLSSMATELASESVTLTTYYPAPSGVYTQMITTGNTYLNKNAGGFVDIGTTATPSAGTMLAVMGGNVGVGTTSPGYSLDVRTGNTQVHFNSTGTDDGGYLISTGGSQSMLAGGAVWTGTVWQAKNSTAGMIGMPGGGVITFYTNAGLTVGSSFTISERMRIDTNGNVGIGVTSPAVNLDVAGPILGRYYTGAGCGGTTPVVYAAGTTSCPAGTYATLISGVLTKYQIAGNDATPNGEMLCCTCPGGTCPSF